MEFLIIGVVTALNLIVVKMKYERQRYGDLFLDVLSLIILETIFGGSMGGMIIAMIASAIISTYLYFYPPKFFVEEEEPLNVNTKLKFKRDL